MGEMEVPWRGSVRGISLKDKHWPQRVQPPPLHVVLHFSCLFPDKIKCVL